MKNIAIAGSIRVSMYLRDRISKSEFDKFSDLLDYEADEKKLKKAENLKQYNPNESYEKFKIHEMLSRCADNPVALAAFEVGLFRYMDSRVGVILSLIDKDLRDGINLELAFKLSGLSGTALDHMEEITNAFDTLAIYMNAAFDTADILRMNMCCDYRLATHLQGMEMFDLDFADNAMVLTEDMARPLYGNGKKSIAFANRVRTVFETMLDSMKKEPNAIPETFVPVAIAIYGEKGSGRTAAVTEIAKSMEMPVFTIEYKLLMRHKNPRALLIKAVRECLFTEAALCIRNVEPGSECEEILTRVRQRSYSLGFMPIIFTLSPKVKIAHFLDGRIMEHHIESPTGAESYEIWKGFLEEAGVKVNCNLHSVASKIRMLPGQIERVVGALKLRQDAGSLNTEREIYGACYNVLDDGRYENIKRVKTNIKLSDVRTNDRNMKLLKAIIDQVNYRDTVYVDWRMREKYSYGRCVSVILSGPPGTGKTMAVHALATELGLELYKVDLSQLVDKYIGETEKRLEEVFTKAEKSNMILFFDEADAIMGKRSETKDSHDKYANTEIAYILQRIEEYDGIVILATNYLQNIDAAFMRRIKYVVNFDLPDKDTRMEIWKGAFAENVPLSGDVDFDFLAENFELSGGSIKNIVLNASFIAAAEDVPVSMPHIMIAISRENTKDKRISFTADYGKYGYMVY